MKSCGKNQFAEQLQRVSNHVKASPPIEIGKPYVAKHDTIVSMATFARSNVQPKVVSRELGHQSRTNTSFAMINEVLTICFYGQEGSARVGRKAVCHHPIFR